MKGTCKNPKCFNYGEETEIIEIVTGKFTDYAYGCPKTFNEVTDVTECCNKEDWEEIKED